MEARDRLGILEDEDVVKNHESKHHHLSFGSSHESCSCWCRFLPKLRLPRSLESLSLVAARVGTRLFANERTYSVQRLSFSLTVDPLVLTSWQLGLGAG
jgi:hypothetical protein